MKTTYDSKTKQLTIVLDVAESFEPSASGKTLTVASTHGNTPTEVKINGKVLTIGVNAYIKNDDYKKA